MEERIFAFWLCSIPGIGPKKTESLLRYFGSPREVFGAKSCQLEQVPKLQKSDQERILAGQNLEHLKKQYGAMERQGISFVYATEQAFPEKVRHIPDAPYGLFFRGRLPLPHVPCVAIVGARDASYEGSQIAKKFGYELAENGIQVISGMARGIDIAAQRGVLQSANGRTYSVLGTGIDICYPREHIEEFTLMQENGGVLSEFPMHTPPLGFHFPLRNRLISAFSDGILVIEARKKSGSLITAEIGLEQGKEIFAVPGNIWDEKYEGSNGLIQNGAALTLKVQDLLDGLGLFYDGDVIEKKKRSYGMLETSEKMVYAILSLEPIHLSQVVERTGLSLSEAAESVMSLHGKGLVQVIGNNYFAIKL